MDFEVRAERLAKLIGEKLGVGGQGLEAKLRRGGRKLPRVVREAGEELLAAQRMAGNPKLARQIDAARIGAACDMAERALGRIDPFERRKTMAINWLASNAFNILIVVTLALAAAALRGLI